MTMPPKKSLMMRWWASKRMSQMTMKTVMHLQSCHAIRRMRTSETWSTSWRSFAPYFIVLISLFPIKKDPNYLVVTFLKHSMETCYDFPQKTRLQRKDLSLRERNLIVRNITWVFDKVSRLDWIYTICFFHQKNLKEQLLGLIVFRPSCRPCPSGDGVWTPWRLHHGPCSFSPWPSKHLSDLGRDQVRCDPWCQDAPPACHVETNSSLA